MMMMNKEYKLLWLSDSPFLPTGYANQSREIVKRLAQEPEFQVDYLASQYAGMPIYVNFDAFPAPLAELSLVRDLPRIISGADKPYGEGIIERYLKTEKYDLLGVLLDSFMVYYFNKMEIKPTKFLMYFPSDGAPLPFGCEALLKKANKVVAMSKFARDQAIDSGIDAQYIPHAINSKTFYPLPKELKIRIRQQWSIRLNYPLEDKFIVGCVARNQGRKMLDRLIVSFAKFAEKAPNAILLFHADAFDRAAVVNLYDLAKRYKILDRILFTGTTIDYGFSENELLEIYNLMDVFALSTSGEGFGIPYIEAMACEIPVVSINYTTTKEIVVDNGAGIAVPVKAFLTGTYNVDRGIIDYDEMPNALLHLYENPNILNEMGRNGRQAVLREYDWRVVYPQWKKLITEVLEK